VSIATLPAPDPLFDDHRRHDFRRDPSLTAKRPRVVLEIKAHRFNSEGAVEVSEQELPHWVQIVLRRLRSIADLPAGWSGRGGPPVEPQLLPQAFQLIADIMPNDDPSYVPHLVPTVEGGLQMEWHRDGFDLEIEMSPLGEVWVDYTRVDGSEAWDGDFDDLRDRVSKVLMRAAEGQ
jgi:hypothetical protein